MRPCSISRVWQTWKAGWPIGTSYTREQKFGEALKFSYPENGSYPTVIQTPKSSKQFCLHTQHGNLPHARPTAHFIPARNPPRIDIGNTYVLLEDLTQATQCYQQQLTMAQEINDRTGEAIALGNLGAIAYDSGDESSAISLIQQQLSIAQELGDRNQINRALHNLGKIKALQPSNAASS